MVALGLALVFAGFIWMTWMKWFDLYVDSFRDVWVAEQMIGGQSLYREVYYEYGFLIPTTYSALIRIFGNPLYVMVLFGIGVGAATLGLVYAIRSYRRRETRTVTYFLGVYGYFLILGVMVLLLILNLVVTKI